MRIRLAALFSWTIALVGLPGFPGTVAAAAAIDELTPTDLFQPTKVWTAHFTISAEEWLVMQPKLAGEGETGRNGMAADYVLDYAHADLEFEGRRFHDIAIRYKGNSTFRNSLGTLKISLKVDLNKYVKGQKLAGITKLNFHNNFGDAGRMKELMAYRLFRAIDVPAPRVSYARIYLSVLGKYDHKYIGLYSIVENIDSDFEHNQLGGRNGAILKPVATRFEDRGRKWTDYQGDWDPKTDLTEAQKGRIMDFVAFVSNSSDADFAAHIVDYIDVAEFARYMAGMVWIASTDNIFTNEQNLYLYLDPKTDRLVFIPWDMDGSWGRSLRGGDWPIDLSIFKPWPTWFTERIYQLEMFRRPYFTTLANITLNLARSDVVAQQVDELARILRPAIKDESETAVARFDLSVAGVPVPNLNGSAPTLPIKAFAPARERSVLDQLSRLSRPSASQKSNPE